MHTPKQLAPVAVAAFLLATSASAATLTGTVTNRTNGKLSKGDTIALINTAQGMDEIAKATSDPQGKFQIVAPDAGQILLHITHAGADYFKSVPPGVSSVDVDVYDSATKVDGITGEALVFRAQTDAPGKTLAVSENFFLQNASAPARTQFGGNTFDFFLPPGAQISQTVASAPNGLPTNVEFKTIDAAGGHYAFTFPIRPGETRFQVNYTLPYSGRQNFSLKLGSSTEYVAVMLPRSMQFHSAGQTQFQPINPDVNALTYAARNPPLTQPVEFAVTGLGQLPQQTTVAGGGQESQGGAQSAQSPEAPTTRPGGGLAPPGDPEAENDPWSKYKWWIVGLLGIALAGGAGVMLKRSTAAPPALTAGEASAPADSEPAYNQHPATPRAPGSTLHTLKDELFDLETDRVTGRITQLEYEEHKAALDVLLRRALSRIEPDAGASNV